MVFTLGGFFNIERKTVFASIEKTDVDDTEVNTDEIGANGETGGIYTYGEGIFAFFQQEHVLTIEDAEGGKADGLAEAVFGIDVETGFRVHATFDREGEVEEEAVIGFLGIQATLDKCGGAVGLELTVELHGGLGFLQVLADSLLWFGVKIELALLEEEAPGAKGKDGAHIVAHKDDSAATAGDVVHLVEALFLELVVPYGEDFIHEEDISLQVCRYGKSQAHIHATGVALDRGFEEFLNPREVHDFIEFGLDFMAVHAEDGAIEEDVFASGKFRVEASANLKETADLAVHSDTATGGGSDAAEKFEEGGLPCPIPADQADNFPFLHFKGDVLEAPKLLEFLFFVPSREPTAYATDKIFTQCRVAIGGIFPGSGLDAVALGKVLDFDHALGLSWPPWGSRAVTVG